MILKHFFCGKDYQTTLRRRLYISIAMGILGILVFILSLFAVRNSTLPDFFSGFYTGSGSGLVGASVVFILRTAKLLRNPEMARKAQITEEDEREKAIVGASLTTVFWVMFWVIAAGIFIFLPLNFTVFLVLISLFFLMLISMAVAMAWHRRHM